MPEKQHEQRKSRMLAIADHCVRPHGAECRRCEVGCPKQAISFNDSDCPVIDQDLCSKCGVCMGLCDAFYSNKVSLPSLHDHLRKVALTGNLVYITCKENVFPGLIPASNVTVLPCIACMPAELWALLLAENVPVVLCCDLKYCNDCTMAPGRGEIVFSKAIELAETWTNREVRYDRRIPEMTEQERKALERDNGQDLRYTFENAVTDVSDIVNGKHQLKKSTMLQSYYTSKMREEAVARLNLPNPETINRFVSGGRARTFMPPKRKMLLEAITTLPEISKTVEQTICDTDLDLCDNCLDCTKVCYTGARSVDPKTGALSYDIRYCVGCGACEKACEKGAIYYVTVEGTELLAACLKD